jgi:ubiquinone/menaquinone biosynthesis C-methylase UbiE
MTDRAIAIDGGSQQFYAQTPQDMPLFYDQGLGPVLFVDFAEDIARRTAAATPLRVLEVAAGTGIVSRRLRDVLSADAHLVVTDLNSAMLDVARAKFGPNEKVDFQPSNALSLPFQDEGFDALICQFGVMFFPDKDKAYREAYRVLASGGHYVFSVWDAESHNPFAMLLKNIVARFCPVDPPRFVEVPFGYHQIDPIRDLLNSIGFIGFNVSVVGMQKVVEDAYSLARGQIYGSPLVDEFRLRGVDAQRVVDAFTEMLLREFGSQPTRMPLRAIVFEARRP